MKNEIIIVLFFFWLQYKLGICFSTIQNLIESHLRNTITCSNKHTCPLNTSCREIFTTFHFFVLAVVLHYSILFFRSRTDSLLRRWQTRQQDVLSGHGQLNRNSTRKIKRHLIHAGILVLTFNSTLPETRRPRCCCWKRYRAHSLKSSAVYNTITINTFE